MATIKSIEEKAKAYDRAIEELRGLLECIHEDKCDIMEEDIIKIFPELKESEDEKIMKALYKMAKVPRKEIYEAEGITKEQALAWLEKQGEQKPQGKTALEAINEKKVDNANKVDPRQEKLTKFEKAVKQVMEEAIECGDTRNLKADAEMLLRVVHNSAWSEEDESNLDSAIYFIRREPYREHDAEPIVDWLKDLKDRVQPQPKQEWSEEDKKIIDRIESEFLALHRGEYKNIDFNDVDSLSVLNWVRKIKSLRFQNTWKPSNEQMEALEHFIVYHNGSTNYAKDLEELRLQLKKLMEE